MSEPEQSEQPESSPPQQPESYEAAVARLDEIIARLDSGKAELRETLGLVREVGFAQAFSFKYSARPGTPAATLGRQVPPRIKAERLARLQALLDAQAHAFNQAMVGRRLAVLLERRGRHEGQLVGRSPYLQAVHVAAPDARLGDLVPVTIRAWHPHSLAGDLVASPIPARERCA